MIIDGKAIAREVLEGVGKVGRQASPAAHLTIVTVAPNFVTEKYLNAKKQQAAAVGIAVNIIECEGDSDEATLQAVIKRAVAHTDGIIVQLPLPPHIDTDAVLASIPITHDVDAFHYAAEGGAVLPPVVAAIDKISRREVVEWEGKQIVVVGQGRLVGKPAARYARDRGAVVTILEKNTPPADFHAALAAADIIITGVGQPHLITAEQVKDGVVVFDAGTSEDAGELVGDVSPKVAQKAALFTPVPGGIGPITIAMLLQNVVTLATLK